MTLRCFDSDVEERDARVLDTPYVAGYDGPHHRELEQEFGIAGGIRSQVEHMDGAADRRQLRDDRRALYSWKHLQHELGGSHQRTGVAGADAGVGLTFLDEIDRDPHR